MENIAIVSCYFQKNYGSMLQAFATQQIVKELGYNPVTLSINGIAKDIRNRKLRHYAKQLGNWSVVKGKLGMVRNIVLKKLDPNFKSNINIRNKKFIEFEKRYNLSEAFHSRSAMGDFCKTCKAVIVGSDQLWLPSNIDADYYTLNFVPDNVNKIAYATSFGVSSLPNNYYGKVSVFLKRINHVSVREKSGKYIVSDVAEREVPVVCDPTLLFDKEDWNKHITPKKIINEKYIFCYFLGNNPEQREFADKLRKKTGYKIVSLLHMDEYVKSDNEYPDYAPFDIGPEEFVNLIRNAEYVLTDSFHGTVFSVINGKKFFTFRRFKDGSSLSTNSRIYSLFDLIGLPKHFIRGTEDMDKLLSYQIEYEPVWDRISDLRESSLKYLRDAIEAGR